MKLAFVAGVLALLALPARAEEVPAVQQSLLFLRVLTYDRNLKSRAGETLTVLVVHRADRRESAAAAAEVTAAIHDIAQKSSVAGLPLKEVSVPFTDLNAFEARLTATHAAAVYVCPGLNDVAAGLTSSARRHAAVTGTGSEALVRAGVSIGFIERDGRPTLLINLPSTRAEGADLDAALLRLAEVIR